MGCYTEIQGIVHYTKANYVTPKETSPLNSNFISIISIIAFHGPGCIGKSQGKLHKDGRWIAGVEAPKSSRDLEV